MGKRESRQLGKKIALIRKFRGKTQAELGIDVGFNPTNAAVRISQYESGQKAPRKDMMEKLAQVLDVSIFHMQHSDVEFIDLILDLFWYEETDTHKPEVFPYYSLTPDYEDEIGQAATYYGPDFKKGRRAFVMTFPIEDHKEFIEEWMLKKKQLIDGEITHDDYFEWKLHWPDSAYVERALEWEYNDEEETE